MDVIELQPHTRTQKHSSLMVSVADSLASYLGSFPGQGYEFLPTAREGNVFRSVHHSVHREAYRADPHSRQTSLGNRSSWRQTPSGGKTPLEVDSPGTDIYWWPLQRSVPVFLECILGGTCYFVEFI